MIYGTVFDFSAETGAPCHWLAEVVVWSSYTSIVMIPWS